MKKARVWIVFLTGMLILSVLPAAALALGEEDWSYTDDGSGGVKVTAYKGTDTVVTVPDTLGGKTVTELDSDLFTQGSGSPTVTRVNIPESVVSIDDGAFWECRQLEYIDIDPDNPSFKSVDGIVFSKDGSTLIHYPAARDGDSYSIPTDVTTIGSSAFDHSKNLESITITSNVTSIESIAFWRCDALTSILIPETVTYIGKGIFANCSALPFITVDPDNPNYKNGADGVLFSKDSTQLLQFPAGNTGTAGSYTVPDGVTNIAGNSFRGSNGLTNVTVSDSVLIIEGDAFGYCEYLERAYFLGDAPAIMSDDAFEKCRPGFAVYYQADKTGFTNPWYGYPAFVYDPYVSLSVTFNMNGSDDTCPATQSIYSGVRADEPNTPSRWAYTFGGWYQNAECTGEAWDFSVPVTTNLSLYAKWTIESYPISYDLGGGTADNPASYTVFDTFKLNNPTRPGYTFAGWKGTGITGTEMTVKILPWSSGPRSYTAVWTRDDYAITYDLGGGAADNPAVYTIESAAFTLHNPTRFGYNFAGWSGTGISGMSLSVTIPAGSTGARGYTANWTQQPVTPYLLSPGNSSGLLNKAFLKTVTSYKITIGEYDENFTLTPVKEYDGATMTINKQARSALTLPVASGKSVKFTVKVTLGKQSKTYTFTVTRAKSSNNALASLNATAGTFSQPFDPNVLNYTLTLDENTKSTTIKAVSAAGKLASVSPASSKVTLNNGQSKTVKITVKAQSGAKRMYTITVVRAASTDANLKSLKAPGLSPGFSPGNTNYTVTLAANKSSVNISAKAAGYKATVSVDGSGKSSKKIALANGETKAVPIVVTSQAGGVKTYIITVARQ